MKVALAFAFGVIGLAAACETTPNGNDAGQDGQTTSDGATTNDGAPLGDASVDSAPPCNLTSPPSNPTCASCEQTNCCAAENSCSASPDCISLVACLRLCYPDASAGSKDGGTLDATTADSGEGTGFACAKACNKKYPNSVNDAIVVQDCEDNKCAGKCP